MIKFLVISGKLKHGKDTFATNIVNRAFNKKQIATSMAFADPIKEMAKTMFPQITDEDLWGPSQNRSNIVKNCINPQTGKPLIVRDVLLFLGKWGRDCNKDCWVNATFGEAEKLFPKEKCKDLDCCIVISDGRFLNELECSKKQGAKIIRVIRPDVESISTDDSETNLDNVPLDYYDYVVYNTSLEKLEEEAKKIVDMYILE